MQLLMIGMDGVQQSTFQRGWTPYIKSLIHKGSSLELKEDIVSRGWAEIFTGRHATETGTLYERPVLDGSYRWTDKCQLNGIPDLGTNIQPLWQVLNERGYRVGIMNVPTTNPAPEVDGFFVSGGGGGRGVQQIVAEKQCHPMSIKPLLDDMGYIVDERLGSLLREKGLYAPEDFFGRLVEKCEKRTECFAVLAEKFNIHFGFLVYKSAAVTAESLLLPELGRRNRGEACNEALIAAGESFYRQLDGLVKSLIERFPGVEVLLVSDHSTSERTHSVNFNAFLAEAGYQKANAGRSGIFYALKKLRKMLPTQLVRRAKQSQRTRRAVRGLTPFDPRRTQAFNVTNVQASHGIFINDKQRFGGPVDEAEKTALCYKIIEDFDRHPQVQRHGLRARLSEVPNGPFHHCYPDIYIDMPEGYTPCNDEIDFVKDFNPRHEPIDLQAIEKRNGRVSVKGHYPLATLSGANWLVSAPPERDDLTVIYDHILRRFS